MEKAAVIIPTIGAKKTKKPVSPEEQAQLWGKMIRQVIASSQASVRRAGFEPVIIVVDNTKQGLSEAHKKELENAGKIQVLFTPDEAPCESFRIGSREAIRHGARAVIGCFDDFVKEASHLDKLIRPIRENRAGFVFSRWGRESLFSFPRPQVINESTVSYLTTLANPELKLKKRESLPAVVQRARKEGKDIQTFTFMFAASAQTFNRVDQFLKEHYAAVKPTLWGGEAVLPLAAIKTGARIEGVLFPRRYEHFFPKNEKDRRAFYAGRLKQFMDGAAEVRNFLERTGQTDKIPLLDKIVKQTTQRLSPSAEQNPRVGWKPKTEQRFRLRRFVKEYRK